MSLAQAMVCTLVTMLVSGIGYMLNGNISGGLYPYIFRLDHFMYSMQLVRGRTHNAVDCMADRVFFAHTVMKEAC